MAIAQIILLSWWFSKKDQRQRPNKNRWVQIDLSKMDFGQVGHGGKKTIWGVFFIEILS